MITLHRLTIRDFKSLRSVDLLFPHNASVLIEGFNESGKSSLFEAVIFALYGELLVTEEMGATGRGRMVSAIRYGDEVEAATVRLEFDVGAAHLTVERVLPKRGQTSARLEVRQGATVEQVRGQTEVSRRILAELGNLTKDALLNSCFVEQKQLGKLEDMSRDERQAALEQLLNLAKLGKIQRQMEVTREEQAALTHADARQRFAFHTRELDRRAVLLAATQRRMRELELAQTLADQAALTATLSQQRQEAEALTTDRARHAGAAARVQTIAAARTPLAALHVAQHRRAALDQEHAELAEALARCDAAETGEIPRITARLHEIEGVLARFTALAAVQQRHDDAVHTLDDLDRGAEAISERQSLADTLAAEITEETELLDQRAALLASEDAALVAELAQADARGADLAALAAAAAEAERAATRRDLAARDVAEWRHRHTSAQAVAAEAERHRASAADFAAQETEHAAALAAAQGQFHAATERAALHQWLQGADEAAHLTHLQAAQAEAQQGVQDAQGHTHELDVRGGNALRAFIIQATVAAAALVAAVSSLTTNALVSALGALVAVVVGWFTFRAARVLVQVSRQTKQAQDAVTVAQNRLSQATAEENAWRTVGGGKLRADAERMLKSAGRPVPDDVASARARLTYLPPDDAPNGGEAAVQSARAAWEEAHQRHALAEAQRADAERRRADMGDVDTEGVRVQSALGEAETALARIHSQMAQAAAALGITTAPADLAQAQAAHAANRERILAALATLPGRRQALAERRARLAERQAEYVAHREWLASATDGDHDIQLALVAATRATLAGEIDTLRQAIALACQSLGLPPEHNSIAREGGAVERELAAQREVVAGRTGTLAHMATHAAERAEVQAALAAAWATLCGAVPELDLPAAPPADAAALADLDARFDALAMASDAAEGARQISAIDQRLGSLTRAMQEGEAQRVRLAQEGAALAQHLGIAAHAHDWAAQLPTPSAEQFAELVAQGQHIERQRYALQDERDRIAEQIGLPADAVLDYDACAREASELRHEIAIRKQAVGIAETVRRRMIAKVLPQTTQNMRQLLPLLTLDRYHDCEITPDYKLLIYDEAANRTVAKNVFSGGARDQFSLALRLAFALATLPEELGTTPGFIFLDEPLSSFDGPRSEALVNLLTHGQIHDNFRQIFVISHNLAFDRGAFTHHLRLEYGTVVESTLPSA